MKKFFYNFIGLFLLLPVFTSDVFGVSINDFKKDVFRPENLIAGSSKDITAEAKIIYIIDYLIKFILYASGSAAVIMLVVGGFLLVTSVGSEDREKGKKIIQYAVTGLIVVILSYAAVTNVMKLIYSSTI